MCKRRLSFTFYFAPVGNLGAYKIVQKKLIVLDLKVKLDFLNRKFYAYFKNGLNLENPIKNESVDPCIYSKHNSKYIPAYIYIYSIL